MIMGKNGFKRMDWMVLACNSVSRRRRRCMYNIGGGVVNMDNEKSLKCKKGKKQWPWVLFPWYFMFEMEGDD